MKIAYPNEGVSPRVSMRGPKPEPKQNPRHRHRKSALNYHLLPPQHTAPRAPGRSQPLPKIHYNWSWCVGQLPGPLTAHHWSMQACLSLVKLNWLLRRKNVRYGTCKGTPSAPTPPPPQTPQST
jgi:hypothetical protein